MTAKAQAKAEVRQPRWARKSTLVLAMVLLAFILFGTTTQTWIDVRLDPTAVSNSDLHVPGNKAATAVTALALVALAGGLAASIAGRIARWIIAVIIVVSAAGTILAAATVLGDPLGAAQGSIAAATGVSGGQAAVSTTVFPVLAVVAGALLAVCGALLPIAGRYWKTRTKYDAGRTAKERGAGPVDEIDSWDSLSRGEDPT